MLDAVSSEIVEWAKCYGTFHLSELAGWTMAGPVSFKMKFSRLFPRVFAKNSSPSWIPFRI